MNRYVFTDQHHVYTRITKRKALERYLAKEPFHLCPVKLRPGFPWAPNMPCPGRDDDCERDELVFRKICFDFEWYNCNMNETGYYTAFYVVTEKAAPKGWAAVDTSTEATS